MFWQDDDKPNAIRMPDDILDLLFEIRCRELPVDHAYDLAEALRAYLPELGEDGRLGVHSMHLAGSQNGWERPDPTLGQRLMLSRRTRLTLRVPRERVSEIQDKLDGATLDIGGCSLTIGKARRKPLSSLSTVISRHVVLDEGEVEDESRFLQRIVSDLAARGIRVRKALCGRTVELAGPDGPIRTRSLMLADLGADESVRLQQEGIGPLRHMGCGLFIPHKGINAVSQAQDDA